MNKIIGKLAEANDLKGVIDVADFNDPDKLGRGKEMVDRLSNLVAIFDNPTLDFRRAAADAAERTCQRLLSRFDTSARRRTAARPYVSRERGLRS